MRIRMSRAVRVALLLLLTASGVAPLQGQGTPGLDPGRLELTRDDLGRILQELEEVANSPAYSQRIREVARRDMSAVRERLTSGDFRAGDRVVLRVESFPDLSDTLMVEPGPRVVVPTLGPVSLEGVLRSELQDHLRQEIARYIRDPRVQATSLIRLSVQGMVVAPGFYTLPANVLLSEALMQAGGPDRGADLERLRVERNGEVLWEGEPLQEVMVEGRTLDQLNLRAGDQIVLPQARQSLLFQIGRYGAIIATTVLLGARVF